MGLFNLLDPILNFVLGPFLWMPPFLGLLILTFLISLAITVSYKYLTDQDLMKELKGELKELQEEMKKLKEDPKKVMKVQKQMMETNMKYMTHSMRPTLYTFIPIIIVFGWLNATFAYLPLLPDQEFTADLKFNKDVSGSVIVDVPREIQVISGSVQNIVEGKTHFGFKASESGEYLITFKHGEDIYSKRILVSEGKKYYHPIKRYKSLIDYLYSYKDGYFDTKGDLTEIKISNPPLRPLGENFNIFGWHPGWLGFYIILSIIFSIALRKVMNVY